MKKFEAILTKYRNRWVELSIDIEKWWVLHFGEWFIGIGITRRTFHPRPLSYDAASSYDTVKNNRMRLDLSVSENDRLANSDARSDSGIRPDTNVGAQL